jgi:MoxR-like ATPase
MPYTYSCHEETTADDLVVTPDLEYDENGNRKTVLRTGALLSAWSKEVGGGVCVLEELDAAIPGRLIACHALLDGQSLIYKSFVMGEKTYTKYDKFVCFASSNTRGAGENARIYAGTQIQNAALMSRFSLSFEVDYLPYSVEYDFLTSKGVNSDIADLMLKVADSIRKSPSIEDGISLRDLRNWAQAAQIWMDTHNINPKVDSLKDLWYNAYMPSCVMAIVTRHAEQDTRDAIMQYLNIVR